MPWAGLQSGVHHLRRQIMTRAVHAMLAFGQRLSPVAARALGRNLGRLSGCGGPLRWRLAHHWRLAGIAANSEQLDRYFAHLGHWFGESMSLFGHGDAAAATDAYLDLQQVHHVESALKGGRGAILADFHYHCHEMACAALARRFPLVGLVRESTNPAHRAVKQRWYAALGIETVTRSRSHGVKLAEALDFLAVLGENKLLAVAPDVLGPVGQGAPVDFFGRRVELPGGLIALAMGAGAPVVFAWPTWHGRRLTIRFDEPLTFSKRGNRTAILQAGLQEWARRLEALLRSQPECWMQWLDKQWSRVWRGQR